MLFKHCDRYVKKPIKLRLLSRLTSCQCAVAAICAYLADAFPQAGLAPAATSPLRAPYYRWLFFAAGPVEAAVSNKALGFVVPPGRERMMGYRSYAEVMQSLEGAVSQGEYLPGSQFSAVDVYLGSHLGFGMQFGTIEKRPVFEQYWARLAARPAAVRAREMDDAPTVSAAPTPKSTSSPVRTP